MELAHVTLMEGETLWLVARPTTPANATLYRAQVSAATLQLFGPDSDTALVTRTLALTADPGSADYAQCMFSALQTDEWWGLGGGYTFWTLLRPSDYPMQGGQVYRVEVSLSAGHTTPTWPLIDDYGDIKLLWVVAVKSAVSA